MGHYFHSKNKGWGDTLPGPKKTPPLYNKEDMGTRCRKEGTHCTQKSLTRQTVITPPIFHHLPDTLLSSKEVKESKEEREGRGRWEKK